MLKTKNWKIHIYFIICFFFPFEKTNSKQWNNRDPIICIHVYFKLIIYMSHDYYLFLYKHNINIKSKLRFLWYLAFQGSWQNICERFLPESGLLHYILEKEKASYIICVLNYRTKWYPYLKCLLGISDNRE